MLIHTGDQGRGPSDKSFLARANHDTKLLALLHNRRAVDGLADVARDGQRFAGQGTLINRERQAGGFAGDVEAEQAAVGGDDVAETENNNVAGNEKGRVDFGQLAVAPDAGLEGERVLERVESGFGLGFLDVADDCIDEQNGENDAKVDPILNDGGNDGGYLDEIGERAEEVRQELEELGLLENDDDGE